MHKEYVDVIIEDLFRLYFKKGRASDAEYLLVISRLKNIRNYFQEVTNDLV